MPFHLSDFERSTLGERIRQAKSLDTSHFELKNCVSAACFLAGILYPETYVTASSETYLVLQEYLTEIARYRTSSFEVPDDAIVVGLKMADEEKYFHMALIDPAYKFHVIERQGYKQPLTMGSLNSMIREYDGGRHHEIVFLKNKVPQSTGPISPFPRLHRS